jgi:hypothetical protein
MKMTGFAAGTLLAAAAFAFPAPSQAQVRVGDVLGGRDSRVHGDTGYGFDQTYRIGYEKGVEDGQKRGGKDGSKGDDYRGLIHDSKYRKGDAGYKKSYGPRQDYIAGYRDGYEQAYRRGYRTGDGRDARVRGRGRDRRGRVDPSDRDDPYGYGRDDRYGRDRNGAYGDDRDDPYGRDEVYGRDPDGGEDDYEDDVIYEEPPGRW